MKMVMLLMPNQDKIVTANTKAIYHHSRRFLSNIAVQPFNRIENIIGISTSQPLITPHIDQSIQ